MARAELEEQTLAALRIQSVWRMYVARRYYHGVRDRVILIQSHARGYLARKRFVAQFQTTEIVTATSTSLLTNIASKVILYCEDGFHETFVLS